MHQKRYKNLVLDHNYLNYLKQALKKNKKIKKDELHLNLYQNIDNIL